MEPSEAGCQIEAGEMLFSSGPVFVLAKDCCVRPGYIKILWWWGLLLGTVTTSVSADGLLSLKVENDLFSAGGDGHYTNGIEGIWTFEPADGHWSRRFAKPIKLGSRAVAWVESEIEDWINDVIHQRDSETESPQMVNR